MFQPLRGEYRFALSGLRPGAVLSTQGGAALCPGLICSGPIAGTAVVVQFGQHGQQQLEVLEPVEVFLLDVGFFRRAHDAYSMHHDSVERK